MLLQKISFSSYPQQRATPGQHCDTWKDGTLTHAGASQERLQQRTMNATLSGQQNPNNSRGETISSKSIYPKMKTIQPSENIVCLSQNKTTVRVPCSEILTFPCQQKWTWPSNCAEVYSMLIIQRAEPTVLHYIRHFLKIHIFPTTHREIHCPSFGL